MDLKVDGKSLLDMGLMITSWDLSAQNVSANYVQVNGRNSRKLQTANTTDRTLTINGLIKAPGQYELDNIIGDIHSAVVKTRPLEVQRYYDDIYGDNQATAYVNPGQGTEHPRNYEWLSREHYDLVKSHTTIPGKFLRVMIDSSDVSQDTSTNFTDVYKVTLTFKTADISNEYTKLETTNSLPLYYGAVDNSMLDQPWTITATVNGAIDGFNIKWGNSVWSYSGALYPGDILVIKPTSTYKGSQNVTAFTNKGYLVATNGQPVVSSPNVSIKVDGLVNLY